MKNYYTDQIDAAVKRNDQDYDVNIKIGDSNNMTAFTPAQRERAAGNVWAK